YRPPARLQRLAEVDAGIPARAHSAVTGCGVQRERKNIRGLNELAEAQRGRVETDAERVPNRFCAQHTHTPGQDRCGAVRPRVVDDEILEAVDARVSVVRDVPREIGDSAPSPVHAIARGEALFFRDVMVNL